MSEYDLGVVLLLSAWCLVWGAVFFALIYPRT